MIFIGAVSVLQMNCTAGQGISLAMTVNFFIKPMMAGKIGRL